MRFTSRATPPTPAVLTALVLAFALPGLFNHDPWKAFDVISIELIQQMHRTGQWLVPQLAGEAWLQISPLYLWVGLLFAKLGLALSLPLHAVVRLASLLCLGIACVNVYRSAARSAIRPADAPTSASAAVVLLIGCVGLMVHAHEAISDLASLAAMSVGFAALSRGAERPVRRGLLCAIALAACFLGGGVVPTLGLRAAIVARSFFAHDAHDAAQRRFAFIALPIGCALAAAWPVLLIVHTPSAFSLLSSHTFQWTQTFAASLSYFLQVSVWFLWPAWPLALWLLWLRRGQWLTPGLVAPLVALVVMTLTLILRGAHEDIDLLALIAPVVLLAAQAVPHVRRGAAAALDWFGVTTFTLFATLVWLGYIAMLTGWPAKIAYNFAKIAPGFTYQFALGPALIAATLTIVWLLFALRLPPAPTRSVVRWAAGIALLWGCVALLWMPWVEHQRSYRQVATQLGTLVSAQRTCIDAHNVGAPQRAALSYHAGLPLRTQQTNPCLYRLDQTHPQRRQALAPSPWILVSELSRAGDKNEHFRLYRRQP